MKLMPPNLGLHTKIWMYANDWIKEGRSPEEAFEILRDTCNQMDRFVPDREIWSAIRDAQRRALGLAEQGQKWPPVNEALRQQVLRDYVITQEEVDNDPCWLVSWAELCKLCEEAKAIRNKHQK
jgi:hypothetical protein